jgi:hypothetical protein
VLRAAGVASGLLAWGLHGVTLLFRIPTQGAASADVPGQVVVTSGRVNCLPVPACPALSSLRSKDVHLRHPAVNACTGFVLGTNGFELV